jgi:hypothetical protein
VKQNGMLSCPLCNFQVQFLKLFCLGDDLAHWVVAVKYAQVEGGNVAYHWKTSAYRTHFNYCASVVSSWHCAVIGINILLGMALKYFMAQNYGARQSAK